MVTVSVIAQLDNILNRKKQKRAPGWLGDAIYGVNDGLGAIFGIIAGVAGYTPNSHAILVAGFFGAVASTLSMGAGAWLSTKSKNELMESGFQKAQEDIRRNPSHECKSLSLIYQEKGFSEAEAEHIAQTIASDESRFLQAIAQEKHGLHESSRGNPWSSAVFAALSTFVGAIVPLLAFFFMHGEAALVTAAAVSLFAHFVVGAAKSAVTVRSWWASGIEMTLAGVIVGALSYILGVLGNVMLG